MNKQVVHYIQEGIVFLALIVAIVLADAMHKMLKGRLIVWSDIIVNIPSLIVIIFIGIIVYGGLHTRPYTEGKTVAPLGKRIAEAIAHGLAWRFMLGD